MCLICYVGAHEGCGCGFQALHAADDDPEERAAIRRRRSRLVELLRLAAATASAELYVCWAGDEPRPPDSRAAATPDDLLDIQREFRERELLTIAS